MLGGDGAFDIGADEIDKVTVVAVDVKPGTAPPNPITLGKTGTFPVALFGSCRFAVSNIDLATVRVAGAPIAPRTNGTPNATFQDLNGDRITDVLVTVRVQDLASTPADAQVLVIRATRDGARFRGTDPVVVK